MEHRERIVGAEEQAVVEFRVAAEMQQHAHAVGQSERGNIGVKMGVSLYQVL